MLSPRHPPLVAVLVSLAGVVALLAIACPAPTTRSSDAFSERAESTGLDFRHRNGMTGRLYFPEIFGSGAALFDYDDDGDLDVYLVQGALLGPDVGPAEETFPPRGPLGDRLFRNDLESGRLGFTDVTDEAGLTMTGYGMGVAAGDHDGDGRIDLYVTGFEANTLLRNTGDGRFEDVTATAGVAENRWSTSAAFVDYDGDGDLDLFVTNYVNFPFAGHHPCRTATGAPEYCGPERYSSLTDRLFRNRGDGTFEDVSSSAGIDAISGAGLGVVADDFNGDGHVDLFVANDGEANRLWIGDGRRFTDGAVVAGAAYNRDGDAEASMGVDAADVDGDGDLDLFMTHLDDETHTLYLNDGHGLFTDVTAESGLGAPSRAFTGFGTAWFDHDNDGLLDLFVADGAVKHLETLVRAGDPFPLHQRNQLFRNTGGLRFSEVRGGDALERSEVSRGAAFGDVDNDGDTDILVTNNGGPARLLINEIGSRSRWIGFRFVDENGRPFRGDPTIVVRCSDGTVLSRKSRTAASYLSSNDPRSLLGLGNCPSISGIYVNWRISDPSIEFWSDLEEGRYHTLRRGEGAAHGRIRG